MTSAPHAQPALLIRITGVDRPGITADVATLLAGANLTLLDVEQVVVQGRLTLALLVDAAGHEPATTPLLADLLKKCQALQVDAHFELLPPQPRVPRSAWAVTLLAPRLDAVVLAEATRAAAVRGFRIEKIARLSGARLSALELILTDEGAADPTALQADLLDLQQRLGCDVALQREGLMRRSKRIVVMDMDSTLIQQEVIDELARLRGVYDQVAAITHRAMNGELDFDGALRERVQLLAGAPESILTDVQARIELMPGAESLIRVLKRLGYRTAVVSGGFLDVAEPIRARLGLDYAFANQLEIHGGVLTGRVLGPIVNRARKAELLETIAQQERVALEQVVAIGDGANDLDMLQRAGLGIAFRAKPVVRSQAKFSINQPNLDAILYLLGIGDEHAADL